MVSFTTLSTILIAAYVLGSITYQLWGHKKMRPQDILPFSVAGAFLGEAVWGTYLVAGPTVLGAHIVVILFAVPFAVTADVIRQDGFTRIVQLVKNLKGSVSKSKSSSSSSAAPAGAAGAK